MGKQTAFLKKGTSCLKAQRKNEVGSCEKLIERPSNYNIRIEGRGSDLKSVQGSQWESKVFLRLRLYLRRNGKSLNVLSRAITRPDFHFTKVMLPGLCRCN